MPGRLVLGGRDACLGFQQGGLPDPACGRIGFGAHRGCLQAGGREQLLELHPGPASQLGGIVLTLRAQRLQLGQLDSAHIAQLRGRPLGQLVGLGMRLADQLLGLLRGVAGDIAGLLLGDSQDLLSPLAEG